MYGAADGSEAAAICGSSVAAAWLGWGSVGWTDLGGIGPRLFGCLTGSPLYGTLTASPNRGETVRRIAELGAVVGLFILLGLAGASDLEQIDSQQHCGWTVEEGLAVPASCQSEEELRATLDSIREERSGGRFDSGYAECAALLEAGDWDAGSCWAQWPDLEQTARKLWGQDGDPETGAAQ